jgi:hypothetical protein
MIATSIATGSFGPARLLDTNSTATAYIYSSILTAPVRSTTIPAGTFQLGGFKSFTITPYGVGLNNGVFGINVNWVELVTRKDKNPVYNVFPMYTLACTLSSTVFGVAGGLVLDTEFYCDTLTIGTTNYYGTYVEAVTGIGDSAVSVPNDIGIARFTVPDAFNAWGIMIDFDAGANTTSMNCLYRLDS